MAQRAWLEGQIAPLTEARPAGPAGEEPRVKPVVEYIVIDELEEGVAVMLIEPWPFLDERGRLRFQRPDQRVSVDINVEVLQRLLTNRVPVGELTPEQRAAFVRRPLRVGDVFCTIVDRAALNTRRVLPASGYGNQ